MLFRSEPVPATKPSFISSFSHTIRSCSFTANFVVKNSVSFFMKGVMPMAMYRFNSFHLHSFAQVSDDVDSDLGLSAFETAFMKKTERYYHHGKRTVTSKTIYGNSKTASDSFLYGKKKTEISEERMRKELEKTGHTIKNVGLRYHLWDLNTAIKNGHWPFGDKLPCGECDSYDCNDDCVSQEEKKERERQDNQAHTILHAD